MGLANFPVLKKYYLNTNKNDAFVFQKGIKKR